MEYRESFVFARRILVLALCVLAGTAVGAPSSYENLSFGKQFPANDYCVWQDSKVFCAGENSARQVSNLPSGFIPALVETADFSHSTVIKVVGGERNFCALLMNGSIWCWGDGYYGQLGNGEADSGSVPLVLRTPDVELFTDLDAGRDHACAIANSGSEIQCWGYGTFGQVGMQEREINTVPQAVSFPDGAVIVTGLGLGGHHACAVFANQSVACWGNGHEGQLGSNQERSTRPLTVSGLSGVSQVAAGYNFSCARQADGSSVHCWGNGDYGQLGHGRRISSTNPVVVQLDLPESTTVVDIALGGLHACALLSDGEMRCWGYGVEGQLGLDPADTSRDSTPSQAPVTPDEGGGGQYVCTRPDEGEKAVVCTRGTTETVTLELPTGTTVVEFPTDDFPSCALVRSSTSTEYYCQRPSESEELIPDSGINAAASAEPLRVLKSDGSPYRFSKIAAGAFSSAGLSAESGQWLRWGDGSFRPQRLQHLSGSPLQIEREGHSVFSLFSESEPKPDPVFLYAVSTNGKVIFEQTLRFADGENVLTAILPETGVGYTLFAAVYDENMRVRFATDLPHMEDVGTLSRLTALRGNKYFHLQTGRGPIVIREITVAEYELGGSNNQPLATTAASLQIHLISKASLQSTLKYGAKSLSVKSNQVMRLDHESGEYYFAVRSDENEAYAFSARLLPVAVAGKQAPYTHWCTLGSEQVDCAGSNVNRQISSKRISYFSGLIRVMDSEKVAGMALGEDYACFLGGDGGIQCRGDNRSGQLAQPSQTTMLAKFAPVSLGDDLQAIEVVAGTAHSCALTSDGSTWCWGRGNHGELGGETTAASTVPAQVELVDSQAVVGLTAGAFHSCAALFDGKLYCWGSNVYQQLGNAVVSAENTHPSFRFSVAPVRVGFGELRVEQVAAGTRHTCALANDHGVWCWGDGSSGQLGTGVLNESPFPGRVSLPGNAVSISSGELHSCALLESGDVWCWGGNVFGEPVSGETVISLFPKLVSLVSGEAVEAVEIAAGGRLSLATLSDGSYSLWGEARPVRKAAYELATLPVDGRARGLAFTIRVSAAEAVQKERLLMLEAVAGAGVVVSSTPVAWPAGSTFVEVKLALPGLIASGDVDTVFYDSERLQLSLVGEQYFAGANLEIVGDIQIRISHEPVAIIVNSVNASNRDQVVIAGPEIDATVGVYFSTSRSMIDSSSAEELSSIRVTLTTATVTVVTVEYRIEPSKAGGSVWYCVVEEGKQPSCVQALLVYTLDTPPVVNETRTGLQGDRYFVLRTSTATVTLEEIMDEEEYAGYSRDENGFPGAATRTLLLHLISSTDTTLTVSLNGGSDLLVPSTRSYWVHSMKVRSGSSHLLRVQPTNIDDEYALAARLLPAVTVGRDVTARQTLAEARAHFCAQYSTTRVYCSGANEFRQIADHAAQFLPALVPSEFAKNRSTAIAIVSVVAGGGQNCLLLANGEIHCHARHIGDVASPERLVELPERAVEIALGRNHGCALAVSGRVHCWGSNELGQLGDRLSNPDTRNFSPAFPEVTTFTSVSAGDSHSCALSLVGDVYCWGTFSSTQTGLLPSTFTTLAGISSLIATIGSEVRAITSGGEHACALTASNQIFCWGSDVHGALRSSSEVPSFLSPAEVVFPTATGEVYATQVAAGASHSCALTASGDTWCWGANEQHQLGDGRQLVSSGPVKVVRPSSAVFTTIAAGGERSVGILSDGQILVWGEGTPYPVLSSYQLSTTTVSRSETGALTFNAVSSARGLRAQLVGANGKVLSDRLVASGRRPLFVFPDGAQGPFHLVLSTSQPPSEGDSDENYELTGRKNAAGVSLRAILQGAYLK